MIPSAKPPTVQCSFLLTAPQLDPDEVARRIGLVADEGWRQGASLSERRTAEFGGWSLSTPCQESYHISAVVRQVMDRITPHAGKIQKVIRELGLDAELSVVVEAEARRPALHLERDVVEWLAQFGAAVDIDVYFPEAPTT